MYLSQTDIIIQDIVRGKNTANDDFFTTLINEDKQSDYKKRMIEGIRYYDGDHDVLYDKKEFYIAEGNKVEDTITPNSHIENRWFTLVVDQVANYICAKPITFNPKNEAEKVEYDKLNEWLDVYFDKIILKWVKGACKKQVEWLHFFFDEKGNFQYVITPAEEIIPIYDTVYESVLVALIRYYTIKVRKDNKDTTYTNLEYWTENGVEYWSNESGKYIQQDGKAHYTNQYKNANQVLKEENKGWGKIPFVPLYNDNEQTDLQKIKNLIDAYDRIVSGWFNDLEQVRETMLVIKDAGSLLDSGAAKNGITELGMVRNNMKLYGIIKVRGTGDVKGLQLDIPVEAKKELLSILRKNIFQISQSVDIEELKAGDKTGIAIKLSYEPLDEKANSKILEVKTALADAMYFFIEYLKIDGQIKNIKSENIEFVFNKTIVQNESELIDNINKSELSQETKLELNPFITDVVKELERITNEKEKEIETYKVKLDDAIV